MVAIIRSICQYCSSNLATPFKLVKLELNQQALEFYCDFCDNRQYHSHLPDDIFYRLLKHPEVPTYFHPLASDLETKPIILSPLTADDIIDFHFELVKNGYPISSC